MIVSNALHVRVAAIVSHGDGLNAQVAVLYLVAVNAHSQNAPIVVPAKDVVPGIVAAAVVLRQVRGRRLSKALVLFFVPNLFVWMWDCTDLQN